MRIIYHDPTDAAERKAYADLLGRIDCWWGSFEKATPRLRDTFKKGKTDWLPDFMHESLGAVHSRLMWEFGPPAQGGTRRLVITPEANHQLRPIVDLLLSRKPKTGLEGWEFYPCRLPESILDADLTTKARTGVGLEGGTCQVTKGRFNRVDLTFRLAGGSKDEARAGAFVATESLLGEELLDRWIGGIEAAQIRRPSFLGKVFKSSSDALPLDRFKVTVEAVVGSIHEQLPDKPWFLTDLENATFSGCEMKPEPAEDYALQHDLFIAITPQVEVWQAQRIPGTFYSERFSRCGESFCYLKIENEGELGRVVAARGKIEDALNAALVPEKLGCTRGGGTGLRYSYIELALVDVSKATAKLRGVAGDLRVSRRSWLLFHDCTLGDEWVGMYPETPAPPAPVREEE